MCKLDVLGKRYLLRGKLSGLFIITVFYDWMMCDIYHHIHNNFMSGIIKCCRSRNAARFPLCCTARVVVNFVDNEFNFFCKIPLWNCYVCDACKYVNTLTTTSHQLLLKVLIVKLVCEIIFLHFCNLLWEKQTIHCH